MFAAYVAANFAPLINAQVVPLIEEDLSDTSKEQLVKVMASIYRSIFSKAFVISKGLRHPSTEITG